MPQLIAPVLIGWGMGATAAAITSYAIGAAFTLGATRLITKRALKKSRAGGDAGGRVQLPPATDNKIPVVYGSAFISGPIIDAHLTTDQKTMYYVIALSEKTDDGTISFGDVYYDGKLVTFINDGNGGTTRVGSLTVNSPTPQVDDKVDGNVFMYFYNNGSTSPTNTTLNAYDVMPSWTSSNTMTDCAFVIVEVTYNTDAGTVGLGGVNAQVINTESGQSSGVYRPGTAILDYMTNTRYGAAIPVSNVNTTSLTQLNTYSDETITYTPVGGGTTTQARYRINGPLDTSNNCLENLQILVDSCDTWLQYSEMTAQWKVIPNKPYTDTIYAVNSSNLIGGIQVSPLDLNNTFNELEVGYPNKFIKDQLDFQIILLSDYQVGLLSPNEAQNRLNISYPLVNNAIQAKYLGIRRLLQSREDLIIAFNLDFSGIQVEAGDVVSLTHETYGWDNKLFRVSQITESKDTQGRLGASIVAFEYNETIYNDQAIQDFVPAFNTGLINPTIVSKPAAPIITTNPIANGSITSFNVSGVVPSSGTVLYMDFNYGNSANVEQHVLYRTLNKSTGTPFTPSEVVSFDVVDAGPGNYFTSVTARNDFAGATSNSSAEFIWTGPVVSSYDPLTGIGGIGINELQPNVLTLDSFPPGVQPIQIVNSLPNTCSVSTEGEVAYLLTDGLLYICDGTNFVPVASNNKITGEIVASQIANVFGNTITGVIDNAGFPSANLIGNLVSTQIANVANTAILGNIVSTQIASAAITQDKLAANSVIANNIVAGSITAVKITAGAVEADKIATNAVTADKILANAVIAGKIAVDAVGANQILANSISSVKIAANAIISDKIAANAIISSKIQAGAITAGLIAANAVVAGTIAANAAALGALISDTSKTYDGANFMFELGTGTEIGGYQGAGIFRTQKTFSFGIGALSTNDDSFAVAGQSTNDTGGGFGATFVNSVSAGSGNHRTESYFASSDQAGLFLHTSSNNRVILGNSTLAMSTVGDVEVDGNITATGTITPFTGAHDGILANTIEPELGDILVDVSVIAASSVSDTLTEMDISSASNQPAIGVYSGDRDPSYIPFPIGTPGPDIQIAINTWISGPLVLAPEYSTVLDDARVITVNGVGEGQINVIGENGNIITGDLIVTSSTPGKGMKQTDDIVRSITVAKARETVTFTDPTEEKLIACIYLAG